MNLPVVLQVILNVQIKKNVSDEILKAYTTLGGVPHLDGGYTVFGRIVEGLDVIDKIAAVETGPADKPVEDVPMTFKVERISKDKITKNYGYTYPE